MSLVLSGGSLIDGTGAGPRRADVLVDSGHVAAVGSVSSMPGSERYEVDGLNVLPGLIDLHTHLGIVDVNNPEKTAPAVLAAQIFRNAELCVDAGFTTARDLGGVDGGLKQAIDSGLISGPRLYPSGPMLCQSGGHGDLTSPFDPHPRNPGRGTAGLTQGSTVCDGATEVRRAVRAAFRAGATQIKMCVSGGVVSLADSLNDTQFSVEELRAAVDEAAARGSYVTGHAHNVEAIRNGLAAGLRCFEHGTFLDESTAAELAAAGAALVPTLSVVHLMASSWRERGLPKSVLPRLRGVYDAMVESIKLAVDAGVTVGSGSDLLGPEQARRGLEIALKAAVMGPMEAIVSATSSSARVLGETALGVVAEGAMADLIVVDFDPLEQPSLWADPNRVVLVVKDGVVVKDTHC